MIEPFLLKLRARDVIAPDEEAAIREMIAEVKEVPADRTLVRAGDEIGHSILLLDGLLCRYKDLRDGSRQISELHVSGDFADLHAFTLKRLDHSVMALTRCRVALAPHERIMAVTRAHPHLTRMFWLMTNIDAAIHREWVLSLGPPLGAVAHRPSVLRAARCGLAWSAWRAESGYALPLTQADLAECLGLTSVHVNRVLKELREGGLVEFRGGRVTIRDLAALERAAEFDPAYLYLEPRPR